MVKTKPKVWINNQIVPWEEAHVPILSHGLSRGSAIFEAFGTHESPALVEF
jgi:branched-chain amino acid aminotransferase